MTWSAFLQIARVRAVEETDAEGKVWDAELRRAITREAGKGITHRDDFLERRATLLAGKGAFPSVAPLLKLPAMPSWAAALCWLAAFILGWCLAALGQESEINLLALPLILILLWNAIVVVLSLLPVRQKPDAAADGWCGRLLKRIEQRENPASAANTASALALVRFRELTWNVALPRFAFRFRAWLHIGAALLALGTISAMYARGWSKEYRAVWESTLLDDSGATRFFGALFAPASAVTRQSIPLAQLPGMRRHAHEPAIAPGDALPWIHFYAATLGLFVIVPRFLLTLLELSRAKAIHGDALQAREWQEYAQRLRSLVDGAGSSATVLTHGLNHDPAAQDRWRHWAYLHWRDVGQLAFETVPAGSEYEFMNAWEPHATRVMLVFNMAATPETEVQRAMVESLTRKLQDHKQSTSPLLLALDDTDLRKRWSGFGDLPARLAERASTWNEAMINTGAVWHELMMPAKAK